MLLEHDSDHVMVRGCCWPSSSGNWSMTGRPSTCGTLSGFGRPLLTFIGWTSFYWQQASSLGFGSSLAGRYDRFGRGSVMVAQVLTCRNELGKFKLADTTHHHTHHSPSSLITHHSSLITIFGGFRADVCGVPALRFKTGGRRTHRRSPPHLRLVLSAGCYDQLHHDSLNAR